MLTRITPTAHFTRQSNSLSMQLVSSETIARNVKLKKLETVLSQAGAATLVDTPLFAKLLSILTDGFCSSPNLTPQRQRDLTIAALCRQILGIALTRPVVLKVADVHWADSSTLELLDRCIASIKTARVFVVCTFRPEFFPHWLDEFARKHGSPRSIAARANRANYF